MISLESRLLSQYERKIHYYTWTQRLLSKLPFVSYNYKVIYRLQHNFLDQMYQIEIINSMSLDKGFCAAFKIDCAIDMDTKEPIVNDVIKTHYLDVTLRWEKMFVPLSEWDHNSIKSFTYVLLEDALVRIEMDRL